MKAFKLDALLFSCSVLLMLLLFGLNLIVSNVYLIKPYVVTGKMPYKNSNLVRYLVNDVDGFHGHIDALNGSYNVGDTIK